jgi:hypothetical protein
MTTPAIQNALLDPELKKVLEATSAAAALAVANADRGTIVTDLTALRAAILALNAKLDVLTTKLNADAGVTDVNYATNFAATLNPAALVTVT